jgi:hypothetical protein
MLSIGSRRGTDTSWLVSAQTRKNGDRLTVVRRQCSDPAHSARRPGISGVTASPIEVASIEVSDMRNKTDRREVKW